MKVAIHMAPGAIIAGKAEIGTGAFIGVRATVISDISDRAKLATSVVTTIEVIKQVNF